MASLEQNLLALLADLVTRDRVPALQLECVVVRVRVLVLDDLARALARLQDHRPKERATRLRRRLRLPYGRAIARTEDDRLRVRFLLVRPADNVLRNVPREGADRAAAVPTSAPPAPKTVAPAGPARAPPTAAPAAAPGSVPALASFMKGASTFSSTRVPSAAVLRPWPSGFKCVAK